MKCERHNCANDVNATTEDGMLIEVDEHLELWCASCAAEYHLYTNIPECGHS